jgi:H+/Cl- antiporter ClcA
VNYLLFVGLAIFSSACGALLVTLLRMTRRDPLRAPYQPGAGPSTEKESGS